MFHDRPHPKPPKENCDRIAVNVKLEDQVVHKIKSRIKGNFLYHIFLKGTL